MKESNNILRPPAEKTEAHDLINKKTVASRQIPGSGKFIKFVPFKLKKTAQVLVAAARKFNEDKCALQASALTFYSLLSIVPVMAMAFGVAKGFGFEKILQKELMAKMTGQEEVAHRIIDFSVKMLAETKGGFMAVIGLILLIWAVVKMFSRIEGSFNAIWCIQESRPMIRKFTDYLALFFTAPLLFIFSGSTTVFITTHLNRIIAGSGAVYFLQFISSFLLKLFPYCTIWLLFTFLYVFMPNKKINIKAALAGGIIAGTIYQTAQMIYINFQVGVSHYNAIYGSFAALPLFLIWLQASWLVLLFGAEIAFTWKNMEDYALYPKGFDVDNMGIKSKKLFCLRIVLLCVQRFARGVKAASSSDISAELGLPVKMVRSLLSLLVECDLISEINSETGPRFQPAKDIENLSIMSVVRAFEEKGGRNDIQVSGTMEVDALNEALNNFTKAAEKSPANRLLKDI